VASSIGSPVNLRIGPSKSSPALKVLPAGTPVRIAESVRGWVHVYADDGSSGWVYSTFLSGGVQPSQPRIAKFDFDQPAPAAAKPKGRIKLQSQMTVRDGPGGAPIYTVGPGDQVRIAEVRGKWARIVTATGESGWVRLR
jgi:SH3-like domain-containing protein